MGDGADVGAVDSWTPPLARRTVLVDNRASCHTPQPDNGITVTDFVYPSLDLVVLDDASGKVLGKYPASCADALEMPAGGVPVAPVGSCPPGRVHVAELSGTWSTRELVAEAKAAGAVAVALYNPKREFSCLCVRTVLDVPIIGVGAAAGRALLQDGRAASVKVTLCEGSDKELLSVLGRLLLCWISLDVRWVLPGDAS